MKAGDVKETYADIKLSQQSLGFSLTLLLENGITFFVDCHKKYLHV